MSWAVTGDVGERPSHQLECFRNGCITSRQKSFFNTVKGTGPCLEKHGLAIHLNVLKKLHIIRTKSCFNTVKWAGPCLGEHDQPFIWTLLKVCITSKRYLCLPPWNELGRDRGCWGARPSHQLESFWNGCITSWLKKFFNTVEGTGPCLGEHDPA